VTVVDVDENPEIAAALAKLAEQDAVAAEDARAALEWIAGEQGLALITQERIQNFCWYQLPVKWLIGIEGKLRAPRGLPTCCTCCSCRGTPPSAGPRRRVRS
jgi:hypothetical protein